MKPNNYQEKLDFAKNNNTSKPNLEMGVKEVLFLAAIFGWTSIGYILGSILTSGKKNQIFTKFFLILFTIAFLISLVSDVNFFNAKIFICYTLIIWLVASDCYQQKFFDNITIHLSNSTYLGAVSYFFIKQYYPQIFSDYQFWTTISSSAPMALDILLLCLIFQNLGYYFCWNFALNFFPKLNQWFLSARNLVNLDFIETKADQLKFFLLFSVLGLMPLISAAATGKFFYINAQVSKDAGVSFLIASFLGQFSGLFDVAWFYGVATSFSQDKSSNFSQGITKPIVNSTMVQFCWVLIGLYFIYQVISGSKGRFLSFVILPLGNIYLFSHQRVSWKVFGFGTVIGSISWLIIFPLMVNYRKFISSVGVGGKTTIQDLLTKAWDNLTVISWEDYREIIFTPFNNSGISEQVTAMTSIIYYNVQQPSELLWQRLFLFWVPRFIWPEKATILSGNLIGRLSGRLGEADYNTSVVIPSSGELFLYFGLLGSILMILPGLIMRWFNQALSPFLNYSPARLAIYFAYLPTLSNFVFANFQSGITGIIMQLSILYFALYTVKILITK